MALPEYELGERIIVPHSLASATHGRVQQWLRCPRKGCRGWMLIPLRSLRASRFHSRPCFHCFRVALLPEKLLPFVAPHQPEDG